MDLDAKELAAVVALPVAGFFARWVWDRLWKKKDDEASKRTTAAAAADKARDSRMDALTDQITTVVRKQEVAEAKEGERARTLGIFETNLNRLDGKVDGLQKHWTGRFDKLEAEFKELENKVEYKLDNLRLELRGDQQRLEEKVVKLLGDHQGRIHDRLNAISVEQAKMLTEVVDLLVDKAGEPRPSPAVPKVT